MAAAADSANDINVAADAFSKDANFKTVKDTDGVPDGEQHFNSSALLVTLFSEQAGEVLT